MKKLPKTVFQNLHQYHACIHSLTLILIFSELQWIDTATLQTVLGIILFKIQKQSFDLTFSCMLVNPGVYRHPGKSRHIPACSKMRGNTVIVVGYWQFLRIRAEFKSTHLFRKCSFSFSRTVEFASRSLLMSTCRCVTPYTRGLTIAYQNYSIHSNSPYPGSLGPGTARNSETPGSWNNPTVPQNKYDLVYTDIYIYTF